MSIIIGLIIFFRDHGVVLSLECFSRLGQLVIRSLVQRKTRGEVKRLTPSQFFDDSSSYSDGDEIESEL
ncbi:hypothetical protein IEQ34_021828 [Dendrobium chrysotoxum]|uniref:Uncharacterized protein n=1 Tax=Dendrobium chrysotoxum TaxID=161865 RepID=A0AAV7FX71_DENCH|nr:hypothetical protein IEQ34_021828 [Dendrobium chrysotoxum]